MNEWIKISSLCSTVSKLVFIDRIMNWGILSIHLSLWVFVHTYLCFLMVEDVMFPQVLVAEGCRMVVHIARNYIMPKIYLLLAFRWPRLCNLNIQFISSGFDEYIVNSWSTWTRCMFRCFNFSNVGFVGQSNGNAVI